MELRIENGAVTLTTLVTFAAVLALFTLTSAAKALPADDAKTEGTCVKLAAAHRLAPTAAGALAIGDCFERAGRTGSARAAFDEARVLAKREAEQAERRLLALEERRPTMILDAPDGLARGTTIRLDGIPIDPAAVGTPIPMEAGPHLLEVSQGTSRWSRHIDLEASGALHVSLLGDAPAHRQVALGKVGPLADARGPLRTPREEPIVEAPPAAAEAEKAAVANTTRAATAPLALSAPLAPLAAAKPKIRWEAHRISGVAIGTAGVVALVVGAVFGVEAIAKKSASNDGHCNASDICDSQGRSLRADAIQVGNAATVALFGGGAAVASGLALFFTAPVTSSESAGVALTPGGVRLRGRW